VCIDGFFLSHTHEPVELLDQKQVDSFLPPYDPDILLDPKRPMSLGCYATPEYYMDFRAQQQDAMSDAKKEIVTANDEFAKKFGRKYGNGLFELHNMTPKTRYVIFTLGSLAGTVKEYIREHKDVGLIRLKSFRPFPNEELRKALKGVKSLGVLEKDVSVGNHGAVYTELKAAMQGCDTAVSGFVCGLGGRDVTLNDIDSVAKKVKKGKQVEEWIGYGK
jgi:pyruvate ferredoxin oxidoreductase alpha subunit